MTSLSSHPHPSAPAQSERQFSTKDFDFELPTSLIAQHPAAVRSASRLLDARSSPPTHRVFSDLPSLLDPGDLLVLNDTRVVKARIFGQKKSGGKLQILIERVLSEQEAVVHLRVSKKPKIGDELVLGTGSNPVRATLLGRWPDEQGNLFRFGFSQDPYAVMEQLGHVPLPPYIAHTDQRQDEERYQSVFAKCPGAVAAPTAALHFDDALFAQLANKGVQSAFVTLHVGSGTFAPVKAQCISDHVMHHERYHIPATTLDAITACKQRGGRVIAVGTTTVRTLESFAKTGQASGDTNIFITPGFRFETVDLLITNFHLPQSTLMMLVSAFSGYEHIMSAYQTAIAQQYRFFSYGDSMLLQRRPRSSG